MDQPLGSNYILHGLLGRGAMGQVFRGSVRDSGFPVAVKILKPELVSDAEVVARFFQERSILTSISHPNVVRVLDLVVEGDTLGIVMELVAGHDLRRYLRTRRTLPPAEAVRLTGQLLNGLAAVHAAGIIHRDVKPENVLVDINGGQPSLKLTDFGVARLSYGGSLTKLTSLIGTPEYMAPELADHDSATPAADLYSTGIVLYEMLSGRTPFAGGHPLAVLRRQVEQPPPPIPGVPPQLWAQVAALLAKDLRSRPGPAAETARWIAELEPSLAGLPALPPLAPAAPAIITQPPAAYRPAASIIPATVSPGQSQSKTVLRRRNHGPSGAGAAPGGAGPQRDGAGRKRSHLFSKPVVLAVTTAAVVLAAALGFLVTRTFRDEPRATHPPSVASYAFAPQQYKDGLLIVRRWTLSGKDGSLLTETVTASSATGKAISVPFQEPIPTGIATTVQTVHFRPIPSRIVQADPLVEWTMQLPQQGVVPVGYQAAVRPMGATQARLRQWVKAFNALQSRLKLPKPVTIDVKSLSITPRNPHVAPAQTTQLGLSGQLGNGQQAPQPILAGAAWTTSNPGVAVVDPSGALIATGTGTTYITAQVGTAVARIPVIVSGAIHLSISTPSPRARSRSHGRARPSTVPSTHRHKSHRPVPAPSSSPPQSPTTAPPPPSLDADATPAFGTCPSSPPPPDEAYCGGWSSACYSASFSQANCPTYVSQGTTVQPVCWTTGQDINNSYSAVSPGSAYTLESNIWIKVSDYPSDPWMNELWFNPDDTAADNLPSC